MLKNVIIEGIDHIGKSTLISNIMKNEFRLNFHSSKPYQLKELNNSFIEYQKKYFSSMVDIANNTSDRIVFDRFHLGEMVYSPLYRNNDGIEVFDLVELDDIFSANTEIILLAIHNFDLRHYDDEAFSFDNAEKEQNLFINAYNRSKMKKKIVYVDDENGWRNPEKIFADCIKSN